MYKFNHFNLDFCFLFREKEGQVKIIFVIQHYATNAVDWA